MCLKSARILAICLWVVAAGAFGCTPRVSQDTADAGDSNAGATSAVEIPTEVGGAASVGAPQPTKEDIVTRTATTRPGGPRMPAAPQSPDGELSGLQYTISRATAEPMGGEAPSQATAGMPLDQARIDALVARLSALPEAQRAVFALPPSTRPVPTAGAKLQDVFPPESTGEAPPAPKLDFGPLEVVRYSPEGEVPIAGRILVAFNQPMVPLTSVDAADEHAPAQLSPPSAGKWRWLDTQILVFDPEPRLPMATEYTVTIPAGTRAATGATLAEAKSFRFSTPPIQLVGHAPWNDATVGLRPTIALRFDQRVNTAAVLSKVEVKAGGRRIDGLKLANRSDWRGDHAAESVLGDGSDSRTVAIALPSDLPKDSAITVTVAAGAPSAEGSRLTKTGQSISFRTYGPMRFKEARCGWDRNCEPLWPFYLDFTNAIDEETFKPEWVSVEPAIRGMRVEPGGSGITISGQTKGRTTYKIKISSELRDVWGQTLGKEASASVSVGSAEPRLMVSWPELTILDPNGKTELAVHTINVPKVRVKMWKVDSNDWSAFVQYAKEIRYQDGGKAPRAPTAELELNTKGQDDELHETRLDLSKVLGGEQRGQVFVVVEKPVSLIGNLRGRRPDIAHTWVQATGLGLTVFWDEHDLLAWVTRLSDGGPVQGAELDLGGLSKARTDAGGYAELKLPAQEIRWLEASVAGDRVLMPRTTWWWGGQGWQRLERKPAPVFFVMDDRSLYKPGEQVTIKGWLRTRNPGPAGDLEPWSGGKDFRWLARDSQGNQFATGNGSLSEAGSFDFRVDVAKDVQLGWGSVQIFVANDTASTSHRVHINEFRKPEYEVKAASDPGPHFIGGKAQAWVTAAYYAGGALPGADTEWSFKASPGSFNPPNHDEFTFGEFRPWWWRFGDNQGMASNFQTWNGKTDGTGEERLQIEFLSAHPPRPMVLEARTQVVDVNRQAWSSSTSLLVHPAKLYPGLRVSKPFFEKGQSIEVDVVAVDVEGKRAPDTEVFVTAVRLEWRWQKGEWSEVESDQQICTVRSGADPVRCSFDTPEGGQYRLTVALKDEHGRENRTTRSIWVSGGQRPPSRRVEQEKVELIPDKEMYQPGDKARILVMAPFAPATGTYTVQRAGLMRHSAFSMREGSTTIEIAIEELFAPGVSLQVNLDGSAPRLDNSGAPSSTLPHRPAYAQGSLDLNVSLSSRTLDVTLQPASTEIEPGGETQLSIEVKDAAGQAVSGAEVAIVVVDEAVLALAGYRLGDPMAIFYARRPAGVETLAARQWLVLEDPDRITADAQGEFGGMGGFQSALEGRTGGAPGGGGMVLRSAAMPAPAASAPSKSRSSTTEYEFDGDSVDGFLGKDNAAPDEPDSAGDPGTPIAVRTRFDALALFEAALPTDSNGRATIGVKLPDSLTRYRIMAIAAENSARRFGKQEASLTARLPLMVRPSAPRFLRFGDRFDLPVVLQNQTDAPMQVDVVARAANAEPTLPIGFRVQVPARDRIEVRFPAEAHMAGTAVFQLGAAAGAAADAATVQIPVWTPATAESFATYGELDSGAVAYPVLPPPDAHAEFGGLEISTSTTQLAALTDAILYLVQYPYECVEQVSSRLLAVASLRDVLAAFQAEGLPSNAELLSSVDRDLARLERLQRNNGGFGFWSTADREWPHVSIHAAHAVARAKAKGFDVPKRLVQRCESYLKNVRSHFPHYYSEETRRALEAQALYVLRLFGSANPRRAAELVGAGALDKRPLEELGWLLGAMAGESAQADVRARLVKHFAQRASETAAAAHFTSSYTDGTHLLLHSERRTDAVILEALLLDQPQHPLVPKVVRGLLGHRKAGRWASTQENAWVLAALDRYFNAMEGKVPDLTARAWIGGVLAVDQQWTGRQTEQRTTLVPMDWLQALPTKPQTQLTLAHEGQGRLYYRLGMKYAPKRHDLPATQRGFAVSRLYEPTDDPNAVRRDADGTWRIRAGATVKVKLEMVAPAQRNHVALVDRMPGGFEAINADLRGAALVPPASTNDDDDDDKNSQPWGGRGWWRWWGPWYEHQNLRDDRAEAFSSYVPAGSYTYTYYARATTPGTWVSPGPTAEEMYHPETFGRGLGEVVVVE